MNNFFSIYLILPAALGSGADSASNRKEYQKQNVMFLRSRASPVHMADRVVAIREPIDWTMWDI
jgi:hypothetical protein